MTVNANRLGGFVTRTPSTKHDKLRLLPLVISWLVLTCIRSCTKRVTIPLPHCRRHRHGAACATTFLSQAGLALLSTRTAITTYPEYQKLPIVAPSSRKGAVSLPKAIAKAEANRRSQVPAVHRARCHRLASLRGPLRARDLERQWKNLRHRARTPGQPHFSCSMWPAGAHADARSTASPQPFPTMRSPRVEARESSARPP